ncbi:cellulose binding domain-containing protein [Lentzea flaviverrucosa]|uniref:GDSL-like Lipase/Acylhydrolase family protein n=1 Tax=Lentzea flaviverrucosa TaxID=200379 RepID=A0A1H9J1T1_9PSEU|nr:cellulose binding domain-containing protein [Lentzea flaviverrucosa]RDI26365.1 GDSL-like lipase/acylhydrolase family protein [Lentzea flaviverrucosa]SEQ80722.1 GDSL-like Lipase/Acylhydrolase family protein [Lentzea flaviverrucosa]
MYRFEPAAAAVLTAALTAAVTITSVPQAGAAAGCRVAYQVTHEWQGGFSADVSVTNLGDPVTAWKLTWSFGAAQTVTQLWNGTVRQSGPQVSVDNAGHNGSLGTGTSAGFGFVGATNGAANPAPAGFSLNGTECTGTPPAPDPLTQAHTAGRVTASGQYTWPGVYFEGRFRGTGVGIVLNDSVNDYDVQIDGTTVATLVTPGRTTHWVRDLSNTEHRVRLVKRTESTWAAGEFGGFVAANGGSILAKPAARTRQVEFIGDSLTAGYGNLSTTRDCSANGGVARNTNTDISFGALAAKALNADYQVNAFSGLGVVRNYNGHTPGTSYRTYYDRALLHVDGDVWRNPGTWRPQLVVVGLGTNDFSTALNPGEQWPDQNSLVTAYKSAYQGFLDKLRTRYGPATTIVVSVPEASGAFADAVRQVVQDRNSQGDSRVRHWNYSDPALDRLGCDWHFSARDHRLIAGKLGDYLATLPLAW